MKFLDQAKVFVRSGDGGAGAIAFRREKYIEFGGPDGGDGGAGGDIWVEAVAGLNTLIDFRYRQHIKARPGGHGMGRNRTGASGADAVLKVPAGTLILDDDQETVIADLKHVGDRIRLLRGGNGGFGNARFKSAVNQAPRRANPGHPGEEKWIWLRLKLIADVGLVGLPNAGKSTLLARLSAARPKIANYPFTTLHPNLGVVAAFDRHFVMADIPGLIEGAHVGLGLGDRFLGHIERCTVLLHLVEATCEDPVAAYTTVRAELAAYGAGLAEKPEQVALTKIDASDAETVDGHKSRLESAIGAPVMTISAVSGAGLETLLSALVNRLIERPSQKHRLAEQERGSTTSSVSEQSPSHRETMSPWRP